MPSKSNAIEFKSVSKAFDSRNVLNEISFSISGGERMAIIGPSGTGKSVCMKLVLGLLKADSGSVIVSGTDMAGTGQAVRDVRLRSAIVFQGGALFDSLTIRENVLFPLLENRIATKSAANTMALEALNDVGLLEAADRYPNELSGGMKKRAAFARAVASRPELILFDEPTTGLDPVTSDLINDLMLQLCSQIKCTALLVTHDMSSARKVADKVLFLDGGSVRWFGDADQIDSALDPTVQNFIRKR